MGSHCLRDANGDACDVNGSADLLLFLLAIVLGELNEFLLGLLLSLAGRHGKLGCLFRMIGEIV